jgi:chemotaxis protein CheD
MKQIARAMGHGNGKVEHFLYPGFLVVESAPHIITTILGSCISVCLWDTVTKTGGINHYIYPLYNMYPRGCEEPSFKYGDIAIRELIQKTSAKGSKKLIAKVFGGARMFQQSNDSLPEVGAKNIEIAKTILKDHDIPIISSDIGGNIGRKIVFHTDTGDVFVQKIRSRLLTNNFRQI